MLFSLKKNQVLALMAGDGTRYKGFYKPFYKVKGMTVLQWTLNSLPFLISDISKKCSNCELSFAIRKEHDEQHKVRYTLNELYGFDVRFSEFDQLTRGNLETASMAVDDLSFSDSDQLLILDSDNFYDGYNFEKFIDSLPAMKAKRDFCAICYFDPKDESDKWCFVKTEDNKVIKIAEKDPELRKAGGKPMVGTFFFSSVGLFKKLSKEILNDKNNVKGEYYMSQTVKSALKKGIDVYAHKVYHVYDLGTLEKAKEFENR